MFNEELNCYIGIPSKGRPFRVKQQESIIGKATWFVLPEEIKQYEEQGADCIICKPGISNQRNAILEEAFKNNQNCLMLDDDLKGFEGVSNMKSLYTVNFKQAVKELNVAINIFKLAGFSQPTNLFYYDTNRPTSRKSPISGLMLIKPSTPRFDVNLDITEDWDFCLQHLSKIGGIIRLNFIRCMFYATIMNNKKLTFKKDLEGGTDYTLDKQKDSFHYMLKKWGNKVKPSKNVPYQIQFR